MQPATPDWGARKSAAVVANHVESLLPTLFKLQGDSVCKRKLSPWQSLLPPPASRRRRCWRSRRVTLYGSIDAGIRNLTNVNADGNSVTTMNSNGTYNSNRWGIKDSEDLGNGMQAHFVLESGFNNGTGAFDNAMPAPGLFNRSAYVGIGGAWGNVDLGRQYTVIFKTTGNYDPFNYKYTGMIPIAGLDGARHNNEIQYQGSFNGLNVLASYALGEQPGMSSAGSPAEIGLNYAMGPVSFGGAYMSMKDALTNSLTTTNWTVGGAYAFAPFRVAVGYDVKDADQALTTSTKTKNWWLGGSYSVSPATALSLAYYDQKFENVATAVPLAKDNKLFDPWWYLRPFQAHQFLRRL